MCLIYHQPSGGAVESMRTGAAWYNAVLVWCSAGQNYERENIALLVREDTEN